VPLWADRNRNLGKISRVNRSAMRAFGLLFTLSALHWWVRLSRRRHEYIDVALSPVEDENTADLELFGIPGSTPRARVAAESVAALSDGS